jgi:hypothetical protein
MKLTTSTQNEMLFKPVQLGFSFGPCKLVHFQPETSHSQSCYIYWLSQATVANHLSPVQNPLFTSVLGHYEVSAPTHKLSLLLGTKCAISGFQVQ